MDFSNEKNNVPIEIKVGRPLHSIGDSRMAMNKVVYCITIFPLGNLAKGNLALEHRSSSIEE